MLNRGQGVGLAVVGAVLWGIATSAGAAEAEKLYANLGVSTRAPIGWVEFCNGDCEEYVLLKRKMLCDAGWPREALLVTVVRDKQGDGHAVLTVKTDKGEFILDNQNENVLAWTKTGYRFMKRQSQSDPDIWVALDDNHPAVATASSR